MRKSFITTVNSWRFERPLAIALGASAIFMTMAVPPERLSVFPALTAFPGLQIALALIVGLLFGAAGYAAMSHPWPHRVVARPVADETPIPEDEQGQFAAGEVSLRLRRADRHPDAPVREPIFASRDLGSPFMEVGAFAPPPAEDETAAHDIPEGDFAEIEHEPVEHEPIADAVEPVEQDLEHATTASEHGEAEQADHEHTEAEHGDHEAVVPEADPAATIEPEWPMPEMPAPIAAFAPEDEQAPQPARIQRRSISAMMDRLSAGLERRAAHGDGDLMSQDRAPALRDALDELNRLAARRG